MIGSDNGDGRQGCGVTLSRAVDEGASFDSIKSTVGKGKE